MLNIREEQLESFNQHGTHDYELRLAKFLQDRFADAAQEPTDKLHPHVAEQIEKAREYCLLSEQQVAVYVISAWLLGRDFDTEMLAVREVLTAPIPGDAKTHFLRQLTIQIFKELEGD
jgi:hypothetical protein